MKRSAQYLSLLAAAAVFAVAAVGTSMYMTPEQDVTAQVQQATHPCFRSTATAQGGPWNSVQIVRIAGSNVTVLANATGLSAGTAPLAPTSLQNIAIRHWWWSTPEEVTVSPAGAATSYGEPRTTVLKAFTNISPTGTATYTVTPPGRPDCAVQLTVNVKTTFKIDLTTIDLPEYSQVKMQLTNVGPSAVGKPFNVGFNLGSSFKLATDLPNPSNCTQTGNEVLCPIQSFAFPDSKELEFHIRPINSSVCNKEIRVFGFIKEADLANGPVWGTFEKLIKTLQFCVPTPSFTYNIAAAPGTDPTQPVTVKFSVRNSGTANGDANAYVGLDYDHTALQKVSGTNIDQCTSQLVGTPPRTLLKCSSSQVATGQLQEHQIVLKPIKCSGLTSVYAKGTGNETGIQQPIQLPTCPTAQLSPSIEIERGADLAQPFTVKMNLANSGTGPATNASIDLEYDSTVLERVSMNTTGCTSWTGAANDPKKHVATCRWSSLAQGTTAPFQVVLKPIKCGGAPSMITMKAANLPYPRSITLPACPTSVPNTGSPSSAAGKAKYTTNSNLKIDITAPAVVPQPALGQQYKSFQVTAKITNLGPDYTQKTTFQIAVPGLYNSPNGTSQGCTWTVDPSGTFHIYECTINPIAPGQSTSFGAFVYLPQTPACTTPMKAYAQIKGAWSGQVSGNTSANPVTISCP